MRFESLIDKNGIQRMGICTNCFFGANVSYCSPTYVTCENNHRKNTATIYDNSGKVLDKFTEEVLTINELVKWCEAHGFKKAKCKGLEEYEIQL